MAEVSLADRLEQARPKAEALCMRLEAEIRKLGFPESASRPRPLFSLAVFQVVKDPYTGDENLHGTWHGSHGYRIGGIQLHGDGSFYAEFDVGEPHPTDKRWFVEGVAAWGRDEVVKSEPKLLAALG